MVTSTQRAGVPVSGSGPVDVAELEKLPIEQVRARLGVARSDDSGATWSLLAILPMIDPARDDSRAMIEKANQKGVRVEMITGDVTAIAIETVRHRKCVALVNRPLHTHVTGLAGKITERVVDADGRSPETVRPMKHGL
jgi:hypothetical protein